VPLARKIEIHASYRGGGRELCRPLIFQRLASACFRVLVHSRKTGKGITWFRRPASSSATSAPTSRAAAARTGRGCILSSATGSGCGDSRFRFWLWAPPSEIGKTSDFEPSYMPLRVLGRDACRPLSRIGAYRSAIGQAQVCRYSGHTNFCGSRLPPISTKAKRIAHMITQPIMFFRICLHEPCREIQTALLCRVDPGSFTPSPSQIRT
jgi:hypothetical protein